MKILLVCAAGMSTSLVVEKMLEYAPEGTIIESTLASEFQSRVKDFDVFLIGPQLRYRKDEFIEIAKKNGKKIGFIDPVMYGRLMGKEIYQQARDLLK